MDKIGVIYHTLYAYRCLTCIPKIYILHFNSSTSAFCSTLSVIGCKKSAYYVSDYTKCFPKALCRTGVVQKFIVNLINFDILIFVDVICANSFVSGASLGPIVAQRKFAYILLVTGVRRRTSFPQGLGRRTLMKPVPYGKQYTNLSRHSKISQDH